MTPPLVTRLNARQDCSLLKELHGDPFKEQQRSVLPNTVIMNIMMEQSSQGYWTNFNSFLKLETCILADIYC